MAFNKFDPHRPEEDKPRGWANLSSAERRALLLKYGWWISVGYTAMGFGFITYWMLS